MSSRAIGPLRAPGRPPVRVVWRARWRALAGLVLALLLGGGAPAAAQRSPTAGSRADTAAVPAPIGDQAFRVLSDFFTYDDTLPFHAEVIDTVRTAAYTRIKFAFDGWRGSRVPGLLGLPAHGTPPYPVVVEIDGVGGWKERWWTADSWPRGKSATDSLLAAGFAVVAIDAPYAGERIYANDFRSAEGLIYSPSIARDMVVQATIEHRRLLDWIATQPALDSSRVGVLGLSMGGMIAWYLAALEPRVKATVAGLAPITKVSPVLRVEDFAPRVHSPLLMLMGTKDGWYTPAQARAVYQLLASPDKDLVLYDTGHRLPEAYVHQAAEWLRRFLR